MCGAYEKETMREFQRDLKLEKEARLNSEDMLAEAIRKLMEFDPDRNWPVFLMAEVKRKRS